MSRASRRLGGPRRGGGARDRIADGEAAEATDLEGTPPRRFWLPEPPPAESFALTGDLAHRLSRVLRLTPGIQIELFDGSGRRWQARIADVRPRSVAVTLDGPPYQEAAPAETVLLPALIRPQRFDWLLEKATELGATAIAPVVTARSVVRIQGSGRPERWQRIVAEAAEQCGRATLPRLAVPAPLTVALAGCAAPLLIAAEPAHGAAWPLGEVVATLGSDPVAVLVGPEGGFTHDEVAAAVAAGARPVSLGPHILRAETAAVAALAVIVDRRAAAAHR